MYENRIITCAIYMKDDILKQKIENDQRNNERNSFIHSSTLNEVLVKMDENDIDVLLVDMDEIVTLPLITREHPEVKVIVIAKEANEEDINRAILKGASSFLVYPVENLHKHIETVLYEGYYFPNDIMKNILSMYKKSAEGTKKKQESDYRKPLHLLTRRECEVLQLLAEGKSNREVGEILFISEKTVKNHVSNILMKLKVKDRTKAVLLAIKKSWVYVS